jgi:hypothetical protein
MNTPTETNAERTRRIRNQIEKDRVETEARDRISSLPPGSLESPLKPVLTGMAGSE